MLRAIDKWGLGYLESMSRRPGRVDGTRHLMFCVADHFEPYRGGVSDDVAFERIKPWCDNYLKSVEIRRDADGKPPQHTFFYPQEEYNEAVIDKLADLCHRGAGEVEIHLHHRNDTAEGLREKLVEFRDALHKQHGLLGEWEVSHRDTENTEGIEQKVTKEAKERGPAYGFVHGNWALCNSRPDGDWCGVNEELSVLAETGCYADFTFPSAPSPTQSRMVNAIYRAKDISGKPRSHDKGVMVSRRDAEGAEDRGQKTEARDDELMLIQGPLGLNWRSRKYGIFPRLENGEIAGHNPPTADRVDLWVKQGIHVLGRPEWMFVKVHTHGCVEKNMKMILETGNLKLGSGGWQALHALLQQRYNDGEKWRLHYVTAREMYNIVRAAEDGMIGDPGEYRDYEIKWK